MISKNVIISLSHNTKEKQHFMLLYCCFIFVSCYIDWFSFFFNPIRSKIKITFAHILGGLLLLLWYDEHTYPPHHTKNQYFDVEKRDCLTLTCCWFFFFFFYFSVICFAYERPIEITKSFKPRTKTFISFLFVLFPCF